MTKKQKFINVVDILFEKENMETICGEDYNDIMDYWNSLKSKEEKVKPMFTDNGKLIIKYMQDNPAEATSKEIGEGLLISSRCVAGAMRKLITDGFIEKVGNDPSVYALTENGKNIIIED